MNTVIKVENLSKQYRLGTVGTGTMAHDINRWWYRVRGKEDPYLKIGDANDRTQKGDSDYVWALRDVNFEVKHGEVLGIIGRNGAGKSTLLKILSRTTAPTTGSVKIKGRVASLLEVGTGFHPELTGRENIYLNGAILGMTKREITRKFDEIVDFAGVERYIDTPVKRYSSGMYVRLAFAVAAHLEPEILIVDEVLAVGDAEFQKKCLGKMKDVSIREGRTVLFVSHNMAAVMGLCTAGLVMSKGGVAFGGSAADAVSFYMRENLNNVYHYIKSEPEQKDKILEVKILHDNNEEVRAFGFDAPVPVEIKVDHSSFVPGTYVGLAVLNKWQQKVFTDTCRIEQSEDSNGIMKYHVQIPSHTLLTGIYYLDVALFVPRMNVFDYVAEACSFEIEDYQSELSIYSGMDVGNVYVACKWEEA
ncbi:MAG TPA: ABC transporter ATP-binding protein [Lacibacter sp.]|nr:ABC transporter ATP-binding protein [Lacibacter sp.]HMP85636.1 ABC transporter ATP-binding protein [Lacibacter sp.]